LKDFIGRLVLITGGSSGIGLALACELAKMGANIFILARRPDQLEIAHRLISQASIGLDGKQYIGTISADVADRPQIIEKLSAFLDTHGPPDLLINSAGVTYPGIFYELPLDIFDWMMNVNYMGVVNVTKAVIGEMLKTHSGYIVNISSVAGFLGTYGYSAYGASKYAIRGLSDVMRAELKPCGIHVSVVFPPDTQTPQLEYESSLKPQVTRDLAGNTKILTAERVALEIIKVIKRDQYIITPGFETTVIYHLSTFLGNLVYPIMDLMIARSLKKNIEKKPESYIGPS